MKLLPFETITYETKLTEKEIVDRLSDLMEPKDIFRLQTVSSEEPEKPYKGEIEDHKFRLRRISDKAEIITPFIMGTIKNDFNKITVKVKIRNPTLFTIIMGLWFLLLGNFLHENFSRYSFDFFTLWIFGIMLAAYIQVMARFNTESSWAKADLEGLLDV